MLLYSIVIICFSRNSNLIVIILLLETLSWLFAVLLLDSFKYLIIQRWFVPSWIFIALWNLKRGLFIRLLFKIGLPPFHSWLIKIIQELKLKSFTFIRTIHKIAPIIITAYVTQIRVLFFTALLRRALLTKFREILYILIRSSFFHTTWVLLSRSVNLNLTLLYWLLYRSILIILLVRLTTTLIKLATGFTNSLTIIRILVLSGFPPFRLFWLKASILLKLKILHGSIMLYLSIIRIWAYLRITLLTLKNTKKWAKIRAYTLFLIALLYY